MRHLVLLWLDFSVRHYVCKMQKQIFYLKIISTIENNHTEIKILYH